MRSHITYPCKAAGCQTTASRKGRYCDSCGRSGRTPSASVLSANDRKNESARVMALETNAKACEGCAYRKTEPRSEFGIDCTAGWRSACRPWTGYPIKKVCNE